MAKCGPGSAGSPEAISSKKNLDLPCMVFQHCEGSAGGGVECESSFGRGVGQALETASTEAAAAFKDGTVCIERRADQPRHIEIQVLADEHGD